MTALHWLASDVHAGSVLIVAAVLVFIGCFLALARDEQRKDARARIDLAPLYRDEAGHEAWLAEFHPDRANPVYDALCADHPEVAARIEAASVDRDWRAIYEQRFGEGER